MEEFFKNLRAMNFSRTDDAIIGGVCAGLAHRWGIAPILMRILFFLCLVFGGIPFLIYGIAWLILPRYPDSRIELEQALRSNPGPGTAGAIAFIFIGCLSLFNVGTIFTGFFGLLTKIIFSWIIFFILLPTAVIVGILMLLNHWYNHANRAKPSVLPTEPNFDDTAKNNIDLVNNFSLPPEALSADSSEFLPLDSSKALPTDSNILQNTSYYQFPSSENMQQNYDYLNETPRISGKYALIVLAILFTGIAAAIGLLPNTYGSWAVTAGIITAILGLSVTIAGFQGKRATWLTFFAWISVFPTVCAIFFALILPNKVILNEETRGINWMRYSYSANYQEKDSPSLIENSTRKITADYPLGNLQLATGMAQYMRFDVPDDQAIIFQINGNGTVEINRPLSEWQIKYRSETIHTKLPTFIYHEEKTNNSKIDLEYHSQKYDIEPEQKLLLTSPAALAHPEKARIIQIDFGFGGIEIRANAPNSVNAEEYAVEISKNDAVDSANTKDEKLRKYRETLENKQTDEKPNSQIDFNYPI